MLNSFCNKRDLTLQGLWLMLRRAEAVRGLPPALWSDGKGGLPLSPGWWFSRCFEWFSIFLNLGSCIRLLASGNWCRHLGEFSIHNFEQLLQVDHEAFRPLQCTQHLCQIHGTCLEGPTLEDLLDLSYYAGCKESQFYSLPFGQAVVSMY